MKCPHCHKMHSDNTKYCPETGKPICTKTTCYTCGKSNIPSNFKFCPSCGASMDLNIRTATNSVNGLKHNAPINSYSRKPSSISIGIILKGILGIVLIIVLIVIAVNSDSGLPIAIAIGILGFYFMSNTKNFLYCCYTMY